MPGLCRRQPDSDESVDEFTIKPLSQREATKGSYHNFPRDDALRERWISATRRDNWTPSRHAAVCSDHFAPEAYKDSGRLMEVFGLAKPNFRRYLKADAVPTVFDETTKSKPRAPRRTAVKRRAEHDVQDAPGMANPEDHHAGSSYQNELSCKAATTSQHSDVQEAELQESRSAHYGLLFVTALVKQKMGLYTVAK
ncbi:hypothetical protein HPB50_011105 [Hyalomma asiaticum]|uniref:Uncharacterized protein n=1 Tax=Hyalomma asiaticum TaxID=266040 RepID=A0ACB7TI62_HYAAI|nr:hypothetical protein HPB50_011105 [Hyalomma asiaticum]